MDQDKKLYSKVDTAMNFVDREKDVIAFWESRSGKKSMCLKTV